MLYFPKDASDTANGTAQEGGINGRLDGNERIIIIEDDEALRKIIVRTLEKYGYEVFAARSGKEAMELFSSDGQKKFDLLITDVIMPEMSGKDAADRFVEMFPGLKVIFISGYTDSIIVNHGIKNGERVFLQKPFSPEEIARKVRDTLDVKTERLRI
jgi:DNA-binding NtrC family response regulator